MDLPYVSEKYLGLVLVSCNDIVPPEARVTDGVIILTIRGLVRGYSRTPSCLSLTDMALSSVLYECSRSLVRSTMSTRYIYHFICIGHQQNTKRRVRQLSLLPVFHRDNIDLLMSKVVRTVYFISKIHTSANIRPQNKAALLTTLAPRLRHSLTLTGKSEMRPTRRVDTSARVRGG